MKKKVFKNKQKFIINCHLFYEKELLIRIQKVIKLFIIFKNHMIEFVLQYLCMHQKYEI